MAPILRHTFQMNLIVIVSQVGEKDLQEVVETVFVVIAEEEDVVVINKVFLEHATTAENLDTLVNIAESELKKKVTVDA